MSNNLIFKKMKANVQISAVKKEFKNGQQGWQVFVEGMEGKLRCEMNFTNALKAIRYSFMLSKRLNLQINDIQLAALSLDYQRAKAAAEKAQVAEKATEVAQEVAGEAENGQKPASEEADEVAPEEEQPIADKKIAQQKKANSPIFKQFCELKKKHPEALLLFRTGDFYECYQEDAVTAAAVLALTYIKDDDDIMVAAFPYHALDTYLPKLIRAGHRIAICDQLEAPKAPKASAKIVDMVKPAVKKASQQELFTI